MHFSHTSGLLGSPYRAGGEPVPTALPTVEVAVQWRALPGLTPTVLQDYSALSLSVPNLHEGLTSQLPEHQT